MKKVILTGGTGLIGKEIVPNLLENNYNVYLITRNYINSKAKNLKYIKIDLNDYEGIQNIFNEIKPQYLMHFAWDVTPGKYLESDQNKLYYKSTLNMLEAFAKNKGSRYCDAGTCFEYDINETNSLLDEKKTKTLPKTLYAKTKLKLSKISQTFCDNNNIKYAHGRIFYVYGRRENKTRFVPKCIENIIKQEKIIIQNSKTKLDYMYSKDIAYAFYKILNSDYVGNINICSKIGISLENVANIIGDLLKKPVNIEYEDKTAPVEIIGNNSILYNTIGFRPKYSIKEGIYDVLKNYGLKNKS